MDVFNESIQEIYRESENFTFFRYFSQKLKVSAGSLTISLVTTCVLLMSFTNYGELLCDILTFYFPAKWTLKSISNPTFASDKLWVTYWIIYALLKFFDEAFQFLIQFIPFFYPIKFFFLMILYAPKIQGGLMIYNNILSPLIRENKLQHLFQSGSKKKRVSY